MADRSNSDESLQELLAEARACRVCAESLPLGPRPIVEAHPKSRVIIIGQAPGTKVHQSGVPWDDASGERLRSWLGVDEAQFFDASLFALMPMGFCYPGKGKSGDLPPRPECQPKWHPPLLSHLSELRLTLLIGRYAQQAYLPNAGKRTLTDIVRDWRSVAPTQIPLPHPSPRNNIWLAKNPWFERELVPELKDQVALAIEN